jgi:hypothetical protein
MSAAAAPAVSDSPWRFLDALGETDSKLLELTRKAELEVVTNLVRASKASVLYAYSGNGKSSLINAGLIPNLLKANYVVFRTRPRPPFSTASPEDAFKECMLRDAAVPRLPAEQENLPQAVLAEIASVRGAEANRLVQLLEQLAPQWSRITSPGSLQAAYAKAMRSRLDLPLHKFIGETQRFFGADTPLLFVCDQFEELFVHYLNQPKLDEFTRQLGDTISDNAIRAQFLFSMREDWVGSMMGLRGQIPDVLLNMYQLAPLRRNQAVFVLEYPLESVKKEFAPGVVTRILDDLSGFYSVLQRRQQYTAVRLSLSPETNPYLELPAVQVVAEKLWETRLQASAPFSMQHYLALPQLLSPSRGEEPAAETAPPEKDSRTPAQAVLEDYLPKMLERIARPEAARPGGTLTDLRIDILYAMTDGAAHRKAMPRDVLLTECLHARRSPLDAPVGEADLDSAIQPLIVARLVRPANGAGGMPEYELAHDFLVRSVAALWQDLDRRRAARAALEKQERGRLERFRKRERRTQVSMMWLPLLAILSLLLSGWMADRQRRANIDSLIMEERMLGWELDEIKSESVLRQWQNNGQLADKLTANPSIGHIIRGEYSTSELHDYERQGTLIYHAEQTLTPGYLRSAVTDNSALTAQAIRDNLDRAEYPLELIKYSEWAQVADARRYTDFPVPLQHAQIFYNRARDAEHVDYSLTLAPVAIAGLVLWLIAALVENPAGQLAGLLLLGGSVGLGVASALSILYWDAEWGWRMALAFVTVPIGATAAGLSATVMWKGLPADRLRVLSGWVCEKLLIYVLAAMPVLITMRLGAASDLWGRFVPRVPLALFAAFGVWLAAQLLVTIRTGSTIGGLLVGLRVMPKDGAAGDTVPPWRIAVRETLQWAELVFPGLAAFLFLRDGFLFLIAGFSAPLLIFGTLNYLTGRPLPDRMSGTDYTPASIQEPDYSGWQELSTIFPRITVADEKQPPSSGAAATS